MARKFTEEDIASIYDLVSEQLSEDRESLNDIFVELRDYVKGHPTRYVDMGETLAKIADLRLKQTGQVVEVFKLLEKMTPKEDYGGLTQADLELIDEKVKDSVDKKEEDNGDG